MSDPNKSLNSQQGGGAMDALLSFLGIRSSKPVKPADKINKSPMMTELSKAETPKEPIYKVGTRRFKPSPLGND